MKNTYKSIIMEGEGKGDFFRIKCFYPDQRGSGLEGENFIDGYYQSSNLIRSFSEHIVHFHTKILPRSFQKIF